MDKNLLFTIGEMSDFHDIPAKTLRYYDEVGLFQAAFIGENGYRYYSIEQFETLNIIKYLRTHGLSIKDIKEHLKEKKTSSFIEKLESQRESYRLEKLRITRALENLDERIAELKDLRGIRQFNQIEIVSKSERKINRLVNRISGVHDIEINVKTLEKSAGIQSSIIIGRIGFSISREDLLAGKFRDFSSIILFEKGKKRASLSSFLPAGLYARVYVNDGNHSKTFSLYPEILHFIKQQGYTVIGDAIERVIIDSFISGEESEYITEIEIPVIKY